MTLRKKTVIVVSVTTFSLILILYIASQIILLNSFSELEKQFARQNVERAIGALADEFAALDAVASDWAARGDIFPIVEEFGGGYAGSDLLDLTFDNLRLGLVMLFDPSGRMVFGRGFDLSTKEEMAIPQSVQEHLANNAFLLRHTDAESSITGVVLLPEGPLLVASRPVLVDGGEEPVRSAPRNAVEWREEPIYGALVVGRYLDATEIERLGDIIRLPLAWHRFDDLQAAPGFQAAREFLSEGMPIFVQPLGTETIAGYGLVEDVYGAPALVLRVEMPREIYRQGQISALYFISALVMVSMVFGFVMLLLLERVVLSRLAQLSASVGQVSTSSDLSARVQVTGRDELTSLAGAINRMLEALEQSHDELRRRNRELATLYEAATAISSDLSLDIVLQTVAEQMTHALDSSGCTLSFWNREEHLLETLVDYSIAWPDATEPPGTTYDLSDYPTTRDVLVSGRPAVIQYDDPTADEAELALMGKWQAYTLLMLPLVARDRVLGLVELIDDVKKRDYTPEDIRLAESLAAQAAVAIENARLYGEAQREIAERRQAEEALRESERRFRDVTRVTGDWIWEMDFEGRYTYASPVVEQILGYTPEEVLGRYHYDFFHPDDREELAEVARKALHQGRSFARLACRGVHKDGRTVMLEITSLPLVNAEGDLVGYRGAHRDITAQRRLEERLAAVHALGQELVLSRDEAEVAQVTVDAARLLITCRLCELWFMDEKGETLTRQIAWPVGPIADASPLPLRHSTALRGALRTEGSEGNAIVAAARSGEVIYLADAREDSSYVDAGAGGRSVLCVPLKVKDRVIGVLNVESEGLAAFAEEERKLLSTLADQAAIAIENARLYEEAQRRLAEARLVQEVMLAAASTLDFDLVLERTVKALHRAMGVDRLGFLLPGDQTDVLVPHPTLVGFAGSAFQIPIEGSLVGQAYSTGQPVLVRDLLQAPAYFERDPEVRSALAVPVRVGGRIIAVLHAESPRVAAFGEDELRLFTTIAGQLGVTLENARLFQSEREQREQLRALTRRLAEVEETERRRLARELHDQVGQNLTALGINLNIVRMQVPEEVADVLRPRLDDSLALVEQTTERIRGVMADLRPPVLDDYGLVAALRWYGDLFASRAGIAVAVRGEDIVPRLPASVENVLFRIAQEALTNVAKHSQATQAAVTVEVDGECVRLVVADDGVGFDPAHVAGPDGRRGWGLLTIAERVEAVGGHHRIESRPGRGTRIVVEVTR